ncbi:MAG: DUF4350 domain-containing protein [Acidimicrobiia bacterium]
MIPPSTTITDQGRRTRRTLLWLLGMLVAINVVVFVANSFTSGGAVAGPDGSSFVTTRAGSAAAAGMLERLGVDVTQSRLPLDEVGLADQAALVVIDVGGADYTASELHAIESFLETGGTVVVAGSAAMVDRLLPDASTWRSEGATRARPVEPLLDPNAFDGVVLSGFGNFDVSDADTPILVADTGAVVGVARQVGDGFFAWVADSHPFHNAGIGVGDSAVAVMTLLDPDGVVVFDEFRHGFRQDAGLWQVIPANWKLMLVLVGIVGILGMIAYGRRFGPPHDLQRRLPPGREAYLEAVAGMMTRAGSTGDAVEVIRAEARARLEARSPAGSDPAASAATAGLDVATAAAVLGDATDHDTLMAADAALAVLNRERR